MGFGIKVCIFDYMPKRKYNSEEERIEANRINSLRRRREKVGEGKREDCKNPHKNHKINNHDGFVVNIETMDRIKLNTIILSMLVNYKYNTEVNWPAIKSVVLSTINKWLESQDNWDRKNKIFIFDFPDYKSSYLGEYRGFDFQLYLKRKTEPHMLWKQTYSELLPLVDLLEEEIKNACLTEGVEIVRRLPYNKAIRAKILTETDNLVSDDTSTSESAEEDTA